jgi:hypothetical protein
VGKGDFDMSAQERFDAASVNLNTAVQSLLDKVAAFNTLDNSQAELAAAKAETEALRAAHDEALNRVSDWAEKTADAIRQAVPA